MRPLALLLSLTLAGCAASRPTEAPAAPQSASGMDHSGMDHSGMAGMSTDPDPDVRFMQDMIPHHAQALDMAALVADRGASREVTLMAERIRVSQTDEIARMSRWLRANGASVPDPGAHAGHLMAGMLTPAQMTALAASSDAAFDRLFLTGMIQHHQGALTMVGQILEAPGGAQASDVFQLVNDIEADQLMEIDRMQSLLTLP